MTAPVAVAFCPHPPALVPDLAGGSAGELAEVRAACRRAIGSLVDADPAGLVVVGSGAVTRAHPGTAVGSLHGYGVAGRLALDPRQPTGRLDAPAPLPLSLTVAAWLLRAAGWDRDVVGLEVAAAEPPARCAALGRQITLGLDAGTALLVMGDGSACRTVTAPGYLDERAEGFDRQWVTALRDGDPSALAALDPDLAEQLLVAGRPAWQVAAGAVGEQGYSGELLVQADPYGVQYAVATWRRRPDSP